jgi:hypothetical protein
MNNWIMGLTLALGLLTFTTDVSAQGRLDPDKLPYYVVIETQDGRGINIDTRNSPDAPGLEILEDYLRSRDGERVRTLTDLLNAMNELGYEYVDTFLGQGRGMAVGPGISNSNFGVNVIFRKRGVKPGEDDEEDRE